jgi:hypothetical protein
MTTSLVMRILLNKAQGLLVGHSSVFYPQKPESGLDMPVA